jgi:hypothetical protein
VFAGEAAPKAAAQNISSIDCLILRHCLKIDNHDIFIFAVVSL